MIMRNKYGAKKVEVNGEKFDSKLEHSRWCGLLVAEKAGLISELKRQVPLILAPDFRIKRRLMITVHGIQIRLTGGWRQ